LRISRSDLADHHAADLAVYEQAEDLAYVRILTSKSIQSRVAHGEWNAKIGANKLEIKSLSTGHTQLARLATFRQCQQHTDSMERGKGEHAKKCSNGNTEFIGAIVQGLSGEIGPIGLSTTRRIAPCCRVWPCIDNITHRGK